MSYMNRYANVTDYVINKMSAAITKDMDDKLAKKLSLSGGTMDKGASIIVQRKEDDRYTELTGGNTKLYITSTTGYAGGMAWYDQSKNLLGEIGLYGSKGIPEYYFIGSYSDPFVKVDMEGNTSIKKKLTVNEDIQLYHTKGIYWREGTYGDQFKIVPTFASTDDSNMLLIQSAVGEKDTLPELTTKISIAGKSGNTTFQGNIIGKSNLTVSGTINNLTTKYVYKTENNGYPTYLLMFDVTSLYLGTSSSKWGFNGLIYSSRGNGYINQEEVATIVMGCAYQKSTTIGSTLRLTTNNGNYRPCIIHDTVNDKYYLSLKLAGQGRNLVFQGYVYNTMSTTQINSTSSSGTLPTGYEFTFDPAKCTIGMGYSSSCSGNSTSATNLKNTYTNSTRPTSANVDTTTNLGLVSYMLATSNMTEGKPYFDGHILTFNWDNATGNGAQLFLPNNIGKNAQFRGRSNSSGWEDWKTFLDSSNYSDYAVPLSGTSKLAGNIIPKTNATYNLGSSDYNFANIYVNSLKNVSEIIIPQDYHNTSYTYSKDLYITSGKISDSYKSDPVLLMASICPYEDADTLGHKNKYWAKGYITSLYITNANSNLIPSSTTTYNLGSSDYKWNYVHAEYLNAPYLTATIMSSTHGSYNIGSISKAFNTYYASNAYRFSTGSTYWNGMSYSASLSVHYGSTSTTTSTKGIIIGESGCSCKVSSDVADFTGSKGVTSQNGFWTYSDPKIKKFTDDVDVDSTIMCKLFDLIQIRSYKYRANPDSNNVQIGINAEEFENTMVELGVHPEKYGICSISYKHFLSRGDDSEDDKFYCKFAVVSYEKLTTLAIKKIQHMEKTHLTRLADLEERLTALEQKG